MSPQFFAWLTAFSFAVANVTVRHGMRYSTPLTATFVSLIIHTIVLWTAVFLTGGIPEVAWLGVAAIFLTGIVQPAMRVFQYKGMEKIGTSRAITLRNSYPVLSVVIGIVLMRTHRDRGSTYPIALGLLGIAFTAVQAPAPRFL